MVSKGSRIGPVFSKSSQYVLVKLMGDDKKRAVINLTNMTLVDYVESGHPDSLGD